MILHWIRVWFQVDPNTLQERFLEAKNKLHSVGRTAVWCSGCKRFVTERDYKENCRRGFHEYSIQRIPNSIDRPERDKQPATSEQTAMMLKLNKLLN